MDLLNAAISEYNENERIRQTFDGQVRNMAWLIIVLAGATYAGVQAPCLSGWSLLLAVANWVSAAIGVVCLILGSVWVWRSHRSRVYYAAPTWAELTVWKKGYEQDLKADPDWAGQAEGVAQTAMLEDAFSKYAAASSANYDTNSERFSQLASGKNCIAIAVIAVAVEWGCALTLTLMETYCG